MDWSEPINSSKELFAFERFSLSFWYTAFFCAAVSAFCACFNSFSALPTDWSACVLPACSLSDNACTSGTSPASCCTLSRWLRIVSRSLPAPSIEAVSLSLARIRDFTMTAKLSTVFFACAILSVIVCTSSAVSMLFTAPCCLSKNVLTTSAIYCSLICVCSAATAVSVIFVATAFFFSFS